MNDVRDFTPEELQAIEDQQALAKACPHVGWRYDEKRNVLYTNGGYFGSFDDAEIVDLLALLLWRKWCDRVNDRLPNFYAGEKMCGSIPNLHEDSLTAIKAMLEDFDD